MTDRSIRIAGAALSALCCAACAGLDSGGQGDAAPTDAGAEVEAAPCTMTACLSGCTDVMTDGRNCGGCGHDCLGGLCAGGWCKPEVVAVGSPASIAVDDAGVYWTDMATGRVMKCPVGGCPDGGQVLFDRGDAGGADGGQAFGGLAVRGHRVFFSDNDSTAYFQDPSNPDSGVSGLAKVYVCPATGCGAAPTALAVEQGGAAGTVATDDQSVYWLWMPPDGSAVNECALDGCGGAPRALVPETWATKQLAWGLAVNQFVYFANLGYGVDFCARNGCNCPYPNACQLEGAFPYGSSFPWTSADALTADSSGVYWTSGDFVLWTAVNPSSPGTSTDALMAKVKSPGNLAVDDYDIYFGSLDTGGTIYRCTLGGCDQGPTAVATGLGPIGDIKLDALWVYAVVGVGSGPSTPSSAVPTGNAIVRFAK